MSASTPAISPTDIVSLGGCPVGWANTVEPGEHPISVPDNLNRSGRGLLWTNRILRLSCTPSNVGLPHQIVLYKTSSLLSLVGKYWIDVTGDAVCTLKASAFYVGQHMIFKSHFSRVYPLDVIEDLGVAQNHRKPLGCCEDSLYLSRECNN